MITNYLHQLITRNTKYALQVVIVCYITIMASPVQAKAGLLNQLPFISMSTTKEFVMKKCDKCGSTENLFEPNRHTCVKCRSAYHKKRSRTVIGHIKKIYNNQKRASRQRGHTPPAYSLDELIKWCTNQDIFHTLYKGWVDSDYDKYLAPSVDRLDNSTGYSFENIQMVTWKENENFAHRDCRNGILSTGKRHVKVNQLTLDGIFIKEFISTRSASRGINKNCHKEIIKCCNGIYKTCHGFKWEYANKDNEITIPLATTQMYQTEIDWGDSIQQQGK